MDDLSVIVQSLIDSELDDMILDLVYEIHSSLKGFPQQALQINSTNHIEKQTCICPNCGQNNLLATKFAYHLAKCLGEILLLSITKKKPELLIRCRTTILSSCSTSNNGFDKFG